MCGILGIASRQDEVFAELYDGLLMLQHRGQDASGIVTYTGEFFRERKANGLVKDVFNASDAETLRGKVGIGHVRYPTAGSLSASEAQPFFVNAPYGIYLVHNGNITNTAEQRDKVTAKYSRHLRTTSDSEILLNVLADKISDSIKVNGTVDPIRNLFAGVKMTMERIQGAYSVICMVAGVGMLAFRDPNGIRPLSVARRDADGAGDDYAFASEDVAFGINGFEKLRDVNPGEAILIDLEGNMHSFQAVEGKLTPCIFEYVYLARPDSMLDGISVYKTQLRMGQTLAKQIKETDLEIDCIIPVPDSARPVALEVANSMGIRYREGLVKNRYIGRTFIMPGQAERQKSVRRKLNAIPLEMKGLNILLIDDSIVRGNTIQKIVQMCRDAGAKKVYIASASPPVKYPNVYGIDMPTKHELIADGRSTEEIRQELGADALIYQRLEDLVWAAHEGNKEIDTFDCSCFNGEYVTGSVTDDYLESLESSGRVSKKIQDMPAPGESWNSMKMAT
ncbi:amidophosphoribosyltransferase [Phaeobacter sp. 11ANDIMAR09]|uniref:amidophosphoribosyltransferase n=1 Tax=Phaeobacter sp. 11ANDIMAR09 TaxID=1225647 RepID=UPI0006C84B0A|nr:amidophosphoribosyltransferase [Phaeobacter sp. 11ANDIMAR09]KPD12515.1 amidophosphoribosyltransferase [Phaeobacter sp. 11ANDIMAR09]OIQ34586.1 MAG: amidophosphoribosyltransferase [Roseobacter sp. MedPE-SWchi]